MNTPYVLKGWTKREWQKALELAYAVEEGEDPETHVVGGTYVEVGRDTKGPYVEVNSGDDKGRDLRVRRVYMRPKPTGKAKHNAARTAVAPRYIVRFRDENRREAFLKNRGAFTANRAEARQYAQKSAAEAMAARIAEDNHGIFTGVRVELVSRKANGGHKLKRTIEACSRRGRATRSGDSTAASHLATHCPPLGVRKGNAAPRGTTEVILVIQGNFGYGHGWEDESVYAETDFKQANADLKEYRASGQGNHRLIRRRVQRGTHEPVKRARKSNAAPQVRVLSMKKKSSTVRGATFNAYTVNLLIGGQFRTIEADAYKNPVLPSDITDESVRTSIIHAVRHYRSGR